MKIGNKDIIFNQTILIPDGESATFSHELAKDDQLKIRLVFRTDENLPDIQMMIDQIDDEFQFDFVNFINPEGHSNTEPVSFAVSNKNEPIYFLAVIHKLTAFTKIDLQLMMEKKYD
jgi:hypothetical protein